MLCTLVVCTGVDATATVGACVRPYRRSAPPVELKLFIIRQCFRVNLIPPPTTTAYGSVVCTYPFFNSDTPARAHTRTHSLHAHARLTDITSAAGVGENTLVENF